MPLKNLKEKISDNKESCAILMASFNGEQFLLKQLESIYSQDYPNIQIILSDDGSTDHTFDLLKDNYKNIQILKGPQKGFAHNFMSLLCSPMDADYFAFSDQDDIWEPNKISHAIEQLKKYQMPALYCSRTQLINEVDQPIGFSNHFKKKPSFQNALVQSIAGGNTILLNKEARNLLVATHKCFGMSHDWWAYIMVSAVGGVIIYDSYPSVRYRQHSQNTYGRNNSWKGRVQRIKSLFKGTYRDWNDKNCEALKQYRHLLTEENRKVFDWFFKARNQSLILRLCNFWRAGIYRQTFMGNIGLFLAAIFKRI